MGERPHDFSHAIDHGEPDWVDDDHRDDSGAVWYGLGTDPRRPAAKKPSDPMLAKLVAELFEPHPLRSHVITLHLYIEHWLDKLLGGIGATKISKMTFSQKTTRLAEEDVLDGDLLHNVSLINRLRNIFAHELDLENAESKVNTMLTEFRADPYFSSSDRDPFRSACIQTILAMEATYENGCRPVSKTPFPDDEVRNKLLENGTLFWQECELLRKDVRGTEHTYHLKCPLCNEGTIEREKETLVGHKESHIFPCTNCRLQGDGSILILETAMSEYRHKKSKENNPQ